MSPLAEVKENFLFIANRGWFLPDSETTSGLFPVGGRGGSLGYREAAVLCLLSSHGGKLHILLTKRSSGISFQGDACLPGGSKDSSDASLRDTALREAAEEIGLDRLQVEVICTLPPRAATLRGFTAVTPVVALAKCPPVELKLSANPAEVDCYYWIPLEVFLELAFDREDTTRTWWEKVVFNYVDPETDKAHVIYGLTAGICITVAATALNRRPNYPITPMNILRLEKMGELLSVTHTSIAVTREEAEKIPLLTGPAQQTPLSKL